MTTITGTVMAQWLYKPYGLLRYSTGTIETGYRYAGAKQDSYINIYLMGAREYDPDIGRFISADTIVPGAGNPQAPNRFPYTLNNPIKYTDPSGHSQADHHVLLC